MIIPHLEKEALEEGFELLDPSKPLLTLIKAHKTNIMVEFNFDQKHLHDAVKEMKHLKEVLVVEFAIPGEETHEHHHVWGTQAYEREIEGHSEKVMHRYRDPEESAADQKRRKKAEKHASSKERKQAILANTPNGKRKA